MREHAGKQWIGVVEEIGATLGGNSSRERNNERRRAGGLGNQGKNLPALCRLSPKRRPPTPAAALDRTISEGARRRRPEAAHIPRETCQKETKAIDGGQSRVSVFAEEKPNLFVLWRRDHARGAGH